MKLRSFRQASAFAVFAIVSASACSTRTLDIPPPLAEPARLDADDPLANGIPFAPPESLPDPTECGDAIPCTVNGHDVTGLFMPEDVATWFASFAEHCVDVSGYQAGELRRRDDEWRDVVERERERLGAVIDIYDEASPSMPWYVWAIVGASAGMAAGVAIGVSNPFGTQ